jgi:antitoxin component YwqK of YwqJK toxin-antitoxin module
VGAAPAPSAAGARPSSIADELALLQRRVPPRGVAPGAAAGAAATPPGVADRVNDADRDGRPDQWQYRENGVLVRELFDQNGDGRVDRTVLYDPATGHKRSEEDDANQDGRVDSWVEYQGEQVVRRRQDASGDGEPDAWTFYRGGQLARVEEDRNGDGFRDRVGYYEAGKLTRETEDSNGDGRPDRITLYDAQERVRQRSEDRDGDGLVDARSFYENGKLVRRELVDEGLGAETLEEEGLGTSGDFSDGAEAEDATPSQTSGGHAPAPGGPAGDEG